jgi:hypothetical protein
MDASMILDASDMSAARQVANFVAWVKRKAEELSARPEAKSFARSGAQLPKKFYDVLYPLALFVEHEFTAAPNAVVTPNLGNDNFDATVFFGDSIDTLYIEITRAKDGYDESLRDEVLTREGSVCVTGPIQKVEGRRGAPDRIVEVENEAISHEVLLRKHLSLVVAAVRAKANRVYGKHHLLLLVIDDYLPFCMESDHRALHALITGALLSFDLDFMRLVVLGISGELVLSYQLPRYAQREARL